MVVAFSLLFCFIFKFPVMLDTGCMSLKQGRDFLKKLHQARYWVRMLAGAQATI